MTVFELRDKLNQFIIEGRGNCQCYAYDDSGEGDIEKINFVEYSEIESEVLLIW